MKDNCDAICDEWRNEFDNENLHSISSFYDLSTNDIDGVQVNFDEFRGKIVVIVNIAKYSTNEQHYKELIELHQEYKGMAIEILVFPSLTESSLSKLRQFAARQLHIMERINVNGKDSHVVYKWLKKNIGAMEIDVGTYFVIDMEGDVMDYAGASSGDLRDVFYMLLDEEEL